MREIVVASEGMGRWCEHFVRHLLKIAFGKDTVMTIERNEKTQLILRSMFLSQEGDFKNIPYITWSGEPGACPEKSYPKILTFGFIRPPNMILAMKGVPLRPCESARLTDAECTLISISLSLGIGFLTSCNLKTSGDP